MMRMRWAVCVGALFLLPLVTVWAEDAAAPHAEANAGADAETDTEEGASALNRDPRLFAEAIQAWFDNHTRENAPPPPDETTDKKRPQRTRVNPTHGAKALAQDLANTQHPTFAAALEREAILLYRLYEVEIANTERIAEIDAKLPAMRLQRYRTKKGKPGQRAKHIPVPKMIERVKQMESQRRDLLQLRDELPPLWRSLVQRISKSPAPIGPDDNLSRFANAAILADEADLLKALFERGLTNEDTIERIPLLTAAVNADASRCFSFLLEQKPDLNQMDRNGFTALHRAIMTDNDKMVEALLVAGADRELRSRCRRSPTSFVNTNNEAMCKLFGIEKEE